MGVRKTPSKGAKPDKLMTDALRVALHRAAVDADGQPTRRLQIVADRLVALGVEGNVHAIKEIFDRIDGRVAQSIHHGDSEGGRLIVQVIDPTGEIRE